MSNERNYWIGVVAKDPVDIGKAGGYAQLSHGKAGPLKRMRAGDGLVFYSPRTAHPNGEPLQAFTAMARIRTGIVYQADGAVGPGPFRLDVDYLRAQPASIRPLIDQLSFLRSKAHWGAAFRFGIVRVPEADFALIAAAMGRPPEGDFRSIGSTESMAGHE